MSEKSYYMDQAWASYNAAFNSPMPEADRELGRSFYQQAVRAELESMDEKTRQQNRIIDMAQGKEYVPEAARPRVISAPPAPEALPNIDMYG